MAGLAAAWRLSEPGWQDDFESITVYQRGWRLGGKGASSRGPHGRIEEHGLHVWLGWYENAFRLMRECYEELDRPTERPHAPIRTLAEAFLPSHQIGLAEKVDGTWQPWVTELPRDDRCPGDPTGDGRDMTAVDFTAHAVRLLSRYFATFPDSGASAGPSWVRPFDVAVPVSVAALVSEALRLTDQVGARGAARTAGSAPNGATPGPRLGLPAGGDDPLLRTWYGAALLIAAVRGIIADGLLTNPRGFAAINDEEYLSWVQRHGGPPELADFSIVRSIYDIVFAFDGGDTTKPSFSAGTAVLFGGKTLFDYRGSIFWKMAAGMGDVVFAPLYEALRSRGVAFEFFHRVDAVHPSNDGRRIGSVTLGRQARLAPGRHSYDPLVPYKGLPCFPSVPLTEQLAGADGIEGQPLEAHWCRWPDAERRVLRDGADFDVVVFAIPPAMATHTCGELMADRTEWHDMLTGLRTVATQSFQLWLQEDELDLGWSHPGSTLSAFQEPFNTWSSMPQLIDVEDWATDGRPRAVAYFCGPLDAAATNDPAEAASQRARVRHNAVSFLEDDVGCLLPGAVNDRGFRWELLCGADGLVGPDRFDSQYWSANVDPSDLYVQSLPGTDRIRLRSDESGYDNLYLAGDWTDSGLNAGCIEAAVLSGLQAANAVHGRPRAYRIAGYFMP